MFPKDNVEPVEELSWEEYYEKIRKTMLLQDTDLRQEQQQWAIMRLLFEILRELRRER